MDYQHSKQEMGLLTLNARSSAPLNYSSLVLIKNPSPQTAMLNIIETLLNLTYLYLAHISSWAPSTLIGFSSALMTLAKTVLYWAQEYYCGYCAVGHNSVWDLVVYWIIPNGCVPFLLEYHSPPRACLGFVKRWY